ncbi:MAG: InlB B-repeat-containing protein, partial [Lachnospiraceae bacterium]|nr:InlB B-repeat-containing protein [Lachnospiraceae bacterium]
DVTWDDPTWDMVGRAMHTYFLSSASNLAYHRAWQVTDGGKAVDYTATDTTYEYAFWKKSTAPLVMDGNDCYYVSDDGSLRKASYANIRDAGTEITSIGKWPVWSGSGTWSGAYSGLYMIDGRLFYNDTYSIYSIEKDGTDKRKEFTAMTGNGYIYGSAYRQDKVYYALHKDPNLSAREEVLTAELAGSGNPEEPEPDDAPIPTFTPSEGWDVENPHLNFKVAYGFNDEIEMETSVEGGWNQYYNPDHDPVVLMFFNIKASDNYAAQTFINVYNGTFTKLRKARIYAIDISGASLDDLKTWRKNNDIPNGSPIYGRGDRSMLNTYCDAVAEKTGIDLRTQYGNMTYPFIFYIDENDKIQYAWRKTVKTQDEMFDELRQYCNYKMCNITWNLNGGTTSGNSFISGVPDVNSTEWKWCYTKDKDIIPPKPDYRENYRFEGWYLDEGFTKKLTMIPQGTVADFRLYAKGSIMKGPYGIDNLEQEYTTIDDTKISSTADGRPKLLLFARDNRAYETIWGISLN